MKLETLELEIEEDLSSKEDNELSKLTDVTALDDAPPAAPRADRVGLISFACAFIALQLDLHPRRSVGTAVALISIVLIGLNIYLSNAKPPFPRIGNDWSSIASQYDLSVGKIDHWCLGGGDSSCRCEDPLTPVARRNFPQWFKAHKMNKKLIKDVVADAAATDDNSEDDYEDDYFSTINTNVDVAFIGETIVEAWAGRVDSMNNTALLDLGKTFKRRFSKDKKDGHSAIPLGLAGDTTPNVLWRIQHGELPDELQAKVYWLIVGTNDLSLKQCSEEVVLLGILRVVEELQSKRPNSKIVINSILPMTSDVNGKLPDDSSSKKKSYKSLDIDTRHRRLGAFGKVIETLQGGFKRSKNRDVQQNLPTRKADKGMFRNRRGRSNLWPSVKVINDQLKKFCSKHKNVVFFDANDVFVEKNEDESSSIKKDYMTLMPFGRPSELGHNEWQKAIAKKLNYILKKQEKKVKKAQVDYDDSV